jgi:hypothetical protein
LLLTLVLLAWARRSPATAITNHPYQGITLISRSETSPRNLNLHIVAIDLAAPGIRFRLTPSGGTHDTVRQTTLEFLDQERAQLAINAHFFVPFPSTNMNANLVGLASSEGVVYSPFEPQPVAPGEADQSYAIVPFAPALNIDAANHARIVHRSLWYRDRKHVRERVTLWNTVSGSAQIVTDGRITIPTYLKSANDLNQLRGFSETNSWYAVLRARTAIGLTKDNRTLLLFTVDGSGGSFGMMPGEVAEVLLNDYHIHNALNLDGGGSTTLAMQDPVTQTGRIVNVSSDPPRGRPVGSNLAVFAKRNEDR